MLLSVHAFKAGHLRKKTYLGGAVVVHACSSSSGEAEETYLGLFFTGSFKENSRKVFPIAVLEYNSTSIVQKKKKKNFFFFKMWGKGFHENNRHFLILDSLSPGLGDCLPIKLPVTQKVAVLVSLTQRICSMDKKKGVS